MSNRPNRSALRAGSFASGRRLGEQVARVVALGGRRRERDDGLAGHVRPRPPTVIAAAMLAPVEMPPGMPSTLGQQPRHVERHFVRHRDDLVDQRACRGLSGTKPAPMPWILCGPRWPPDRTGLAAGSTAMILTTGLRFFSTRPTAGQRAAGADADDERIDLAAGVVPDLLGRRQLVHQRVGRVLELARA